MSEKSRIICGDFLETHSYNQNWKEQLRLVIDLRAVTDFSEGWPLTSSSEAPHPWTRVNLSGGTDSWCVDMPFEDFYDVFTGWTRSRDNQSPP